MRPLWLWNLASSYSVFVVTASSLSFSIPATGAGTFNARDYGATGKKADDARPALQQAVDACAAAGGGTVLLPPGEYTSGTLHLRSHVHLEIQAGATLWAAPAPSAYEPVAIPSKAALFYGENLEDVAIGGPGTVDGQAQYEWRADDYERAFDHKAIMQSLGKPLLRSFPKGFPKRTIFPHLVWLGRSKDVRIAGLKFLHSPSWTIALYACQRARFDGLDIRSSLKEAVWADGIDLDGCQDVSISRCTIETGDDCVVFISTDAWGPALPCSNVTVSRCRLSSASAGVKFSEGNRLAIEQIRVTDTLFTNVNRGVVFSVTLGGRISDVVLSNLVIHCNRFDWFWSGDGQPFFFRLTRLSEFNHEPPIAGEPPLGSIRNILIRDVTAWAKGSSLFHGHAESWLERIHLENLKLSLSADPTAPFDKAEHALSFRRVRNLHVENVEVSWEQPALKDWKSALSFEEIQGLELDGFTGRGAWPEAGLPALLLDRVSDADIRHSTAPDGTGVFLKIMGASTRNIRLRENDLRQARVPCQIEKDVNPAAAQMLENILPK